MHWGYLNNGGEREEETREEEAEPGRSHSYATRHNELLSFGDPACGSVSRSAFKRPGSPLFERIQDDEHGIWTTLEKPRHLTGTQRMYINGAISRGTFVI